MADRAEGAEYEHPWPKVHPPDTAALLDWYLNSPKTVLPLHSRPQSYTSEPAGLAEQGVVEQGYVSEGVA